LDPALTEPSQPALLQIYLLTHPIEIGHPTNTAVFAMQVAQQCGLPLQRLVWHRLDQAANSLLFPPDEWCLLYPTAHAHVIQASLHELQPQMLPRPKVLILDATWQRAQKMFNQSPYLHQLTAIKLDAQHPSAFMRRRNQRDGAWCTAEVIQWLWQNDGQLTAANALAQRFQQFNHGSTRSDASSV